jgi:hypothetical protein
VIVNPKPDKDLLALLGKATFVFWTCDDETHRTVVWTTGVDGKMTPKCDTCGKTGEPR